jgi:serine/threonine protein kinase
MSPLTDTSRTTLVPAQVFRAYDLKSGTEVALKIHTVEPSVPMGQREYVRRAIREVAILEGLHHPAIVRLHEVFQIGDNSLAIVMEACRGARPLPCASGVQSFAVHLQSNLTRCNCCATQNMIVSVQPLKFCKRA